MSQLDIISHILLQNQYFLTLAEAKAEVVKTFYQEFPNRDFEQWDSHHSEDLANRIVHQFQGRENLSVKYLIQDIEILIRRLENIQAQSASGIC